MRLFTALDLSPPVMESLKELLRRLQPAARLRWSKPENLHLTLKFIGEWPQERLAELGRALEAVPVPAAVIVPVSGLGFFPNARAPRVFWAGVQAPQALVEWAAAVDRALEPLGIAAETRPYSPHLTLARIPDRQGIEALHRAIEALPLVDFGAFQADRFYLYESWPGPGGSVYTRIGEFACRT